MRARYCVAAAVFTYALAYAESNDPIQLAILYRFDAPHSEHSRIEAQRELNAIMGPAVKLEWHDRSEVKGSSFTNILVLDFHGACDMRSKAPSGPRQGWLARTHVSDGVVLPFGEVDCDLVRASLDQIPVTSGQIPADAALGRALARVLAHELYHFLAQDTSHSAKGLTKSAFAPADLVSNTPDLNQLDFVLQQ